MGELFPELGEWQETRRSLHAWCKVLSAVRGALGEPHPRWWHISLQVTARGPGTGPLGLDGGSRPAAELDLERHRLTLREGDRLLASLPLSDSPSVDRLAGWLVDELESTTDLRVELTGDDWRDDAPRPYRSAAAKRYRGAAHAAAQVLSQVRREIAGERGPVQLWAHHFDVAFELFGSRQVEWQGQSQPAQIGFGFFPGDDDDPRPYFYGTPWPFADDLLRAPLPAPAGWQVEPWQGARLPYSAAIADGDLVGEFLRAVHASGRSVLDEGRAE